MNFSIYLENFPPARPWVNLGSSTLVFLPIGGFCRTRCFCISDDCLCGTDVVCATIKRRKLIWICSVEKGCTNYSSRVDLGLDWCPNTWQRLGVTGSDNKSWFLPTRVISAYYSSWQNQLGAHQQYGQANGSTKKENSTSQLSTS